MTDKVDAFFDAMDRITDDKRPERIFALATVDPAYAGGNAKVTFDGETSLSTKAYPILSAVVAGSRVVMQRVGPIWLVQGQIGGSIGGSGGSTASAKVQAMLDFSNPTTSGALARSVTDSRSWMPKSEITIDFWAASDTSTSNQIIVEATDVTTDRNNIHLLYGNGNTYWDYGDISAGGRVSIANPALTAGSLHHWAFVASRAGGYMSIWLDGVRVAHQTGLTPGNLSSTAKTLQFGTGWDGRLTDVRYWNRPLSGAEIASSMNSPKTAPASVSGLVASFAPADMTEGDYLVDAVAGREMALDQGGIRRVKSDLTTSPTFLLGERNWKTPAYVNGWSSYDTATYGGIQYRRLSSGLVVMRGLVMGGGASTAISNLPPGYRPARQMLHVVQSSAGPTRTDFQQAGDIVWYGGAAPGWVSLSQVTGLAEQ